MTQSLHIQTQEYRMRPRLTSIALAAVFACAALAPAAAQGSLRDRVKQRVKDKLQQKLDSAADTLTNSAVNKGTDVVKCVVTDQACIKRAKAENKAVVVTDKGGTPLPNQPAPAATQATAPAAAAASVSAAAPVEQAAAAPPGQGVWLNYDFVPGERTIFFEDFSGNDVGDFPRRLRLIEGNLEVVKVDGAPMLRSADGGRFKIGLPGKLPERFTVEMRVHSAVPTNPIVIATTEDIFQKSATIGCYTNEAFVDVHESGGGNSGTAYQPDPPAGFVNCTFTVDNGKGIKGYVDEHRTANSPQSHVTLGDTLYFTVPGSSANDPVLIASIRVAAGGKKLYDVLSANGRVSTQGILFDVGSDRIRPESTPTLVEIAGMLSEHPELKLMIEGHTDNVGAVAANQALSEKRAAAVKAYLVATNGIDAARLTSKGFGASKPASPNTTAEGRQNNRRVELVKQ